MGFKLGIVGLPNVGKSTLFNALAATHVPVSNYPFCTIEQNLGVVAVPDDRLGEIARIIGSAKVVPTTIEFVDIAGLVKGASCGEGLGNQFLGHIREVDAIAHVVRTFPDPSVVHVTGELDPIGDIEIIDAELLLADMATVDKRRKALEAKLKSGDKLAHDFKNTPRWRCPPASLARASRAGLFFAVGHGVHAGLEVRN